MGTTDDSGIPTREPADRALPASPGCTEAPGTRPRALERIAGFGQGLGMPIYEFHCGACEADSEVLVRSSDWKGTKCPKCGSTRLEKKFSVFASSLAGATTSSSGGGGAAGAECSGTPSSCGRCCGGGPHRH
jgi:putative FmdB family regulatory protein